MSILPHLIMPALIAAAVGGSLFYLRVNSPDGRRRRTERIQVLEDARTDIVGHFVAIERAADPANPATRECSLTEIQEALDRFRPSTIRVALEQLVEMGQVARRRAVFGACKLYRAAGLTVEVSGIGDEQS